MENNPTTTGDSVAHVCNICKYASRSARGLLIHVGRMHAVAKTITGSYRCPLCERSFDGGRKLSLHVKKSHGICGKELFAMRFPTANRTCTICGASLKFIDQDKGYGSGMCPPCNRKRLYAETPHIAWNRGLSKETDARVADAAACMHAHYLEHGHHALGRTKENDETVRAKSAKVSAKLKEFYTKNEHWSKGLTKDTSEIVARRSKNISDALKGKTFSRDHVKALRKAQTLQLDDVIARLGALNFELLDCYRHSMNQKLSLRCVTCNQTCKKTLHATLHGSKCPTCHPPWMSKTSIWQHDVAEYVRSLGVDVKENDRTLLNGLELDIYVKDASFAIECNGLYWHSEVSGRFSHDHAERKRLLASSAGIRLYTLFEDEWRDKREIVKSMIKHRLNLSTRVGARTLRITRVHPRELREFFDENHIDGHVRAKHGIALVTSSNEVLGACTLRHASHDSDKETLEIARLCFKTHMHIAGGVSRLVSEAVRLASTIGASKIVTFSDNRLGGCSYSVVPKIKHTGSTAPRFWWTDFNVRFDRFKYRADARNGLTQRDVALNAGVCRIFGCSNERYVLDVYDNEHETVPSSVTKTSNGTM